MKQNLSTTESETQASQMSASVVIVNYNNWK